MLYQNYDYELEEAGLILWERPQKIPARRSWPGKNRTAKDRPHFGEAVTVPDVGDQTNLGSCSHRAKSSRQDPPVFFINRPRSLSRLRMTKT